MKNFLEKLRTDKTPRLYNLADDKLHRETSEYRLSYTHPPTRKHTHTHAQDIIGKKLKVATENILRRGTISIS